MVDVDEYFRPQLTNIQRNSFDSSMVLRQRQLSSFKSTGAEQFQFPASWNCQAERSSRKISDSKLLKETNRISNKDNLNWIGHSTLSGKENVKPRGNPLNEQLTLSLRTTNSSYNGWNQRLPFTSPSLPSPMSPTFSDYQTPQSSPEKLGGQLDSNKPRYKTELCKRFEACQKCEYGSKCQYAHGTDELRLPSRHPKYKSQFCEQYHENGTCLYGRRCDFIHSETSVRLAEIRYHIHLYHRFREAFPDKAKDVTIRMLLDHAKLFPEASLSMVSQQQAVQRQRIDPILQQIPTNDVAAELLLRQQQQLRNAIASSPLSLSWGLFDSIMLH